MKLLIASIIFIVVCQEIQLSELRRQVKLLKERFRREDEENTV